jgi:hypothetical protein
VTRLYVVSNAHCPEHSGPVTAESAESAAVMFATRQGLLDDPDTWAHVTVRHESDVKLFEVRLEVTCTELHKSGEHAT